MISAEVPIRIQFYDLDPMNVVWHGNYPRYLEIARCALLDKIGYNYVEMRDSGYAWPIVDMRIKYVGPLRFAQEAIVTAQIVDYLNGLKIDYRIRDQASGAVITKARTFQVPVSLENGEMLLESPAILIQKMQSADE
jgi:acyl-CoA thioester hydrolase